MKTLGPETYSGSTTARRYAALITLICASYASLGASRPAGRMPHESFSVQVPSSEADVLAAVEGVARDPVIHGTYSFDKDRTLTGAKPAERSLYFGAWGGPGKALYKVAEGVLSPVGFRDSADIGAITVRYVVQSVNASNTTIRIDAVFVESAHRAVHPSEGGVESAEYGVIREQLGKIDAERQETKQAIQRVGKERADKERTGASLVRPSSESSPSKDAAATGSAIQELEQQVATLRRMVRTRVLGSATLLKAAPYKSAATLATLPSDTDVVVLILTRYWYGVETADGHRGWIHRNQVEALP